MKTLHIITSLSTGGAERMLYNLLAGGLSRRFDTAVLSLNDIGTIGTLIHELNVPVFTLEMNSSFPGPKSFMKLLHYVREINPDVIQGWMYHGNLAASFARKFAKGCTFLVWNVRQCLYDIGLEKPLTRQVIRLNRWLSGSVDSIIYNSRVAREQHEGFGFYGDRSLIIPNGFDLDRLKPNLDAGAKIREEIGFHENAIVIGHVARYHPMKDHAAFLQAAVHVAAVIPTACFLVVGRDVSLTNAALAKHVPSDLTDRFVFMGECSNVHQLMQAMDVFCLSSWSEAFPNVVGEAMACGVPCVVTDVGDSQDIVGDTGIVVPASDSDALAQGLLSMIEKPREKRLELGHAARGRVKRLYGLDSVLARYTDLYESLVQKSRRN